MTREANRRKDRSGNENGSDRGDDVWPDWKSLAAHAFLRGYGRIDPAVPGRQDRNRKSAAGRKLDPAELADSEKEHWRQALKAASETASARLRDGDGALDKSAALEAVTDKGLERLFELLHIPLIGLEPRDLARVANLVHSAAQTAVKTQVAVDEQRLRRKRDDLLPELLRRVEEERRRLELEREQFSENRQRISDS